MLKVPASRKHFDWFLIVANVLLPLGLGAIGGFFPEEIKGAHFPRTFPYEVAWYATLFWFGVIAAMVVASVQAWLSLSSQAHGEEEQRQLQQKLVAVQQKLVAVQRTVALTAPAQITHTTVAEIAALVTAGKVAHDEAIVRILGALAVLAWRHDGMPQATYATNLMLFTEGRTHDLLFNDHETSGLDGALVLAPALSANSVKGKKPDATLIDVALPIPNAHARGDRSCRVLPGAPLAFCSNRHEYYREVALLAEFCRSVGQFEPRVADEVEQYFQAQRATIASLLAVPLRNRETSTTIGVLNFHSDIVGIFGEDPTAFLTLVDQTVDVLIAILDERPEGPQDDRHAERIHEGTGAGHSGAGPQRENGSG